MSCPAFKETRNLTRLLPGSDTGFPVRNVATACSGRILFTEWVCWNQRTSFLWTSWQMASMLVKTNQKLCEGTMVQGRRHTDSLRSGKSLEEKPDRITRWGGEGGAAEVAVGTVPARANCSRKKLLLREGWSQVVCFHPYPKHLNVWSR